MIFVQNKTEQTIRRLGVALGAHNNPKDEKIEKNTISTVNNYFQEDKEKPPIIKINQQKEVEKQKERDNQINQKFLHSGNNIFSLGKKQFLENKKRNKNYAVKLKNNMIFQLNVPGCTPYDPYLIKVCKNALISVKDELPNYKEIIKKINTEFGIEEGHNLIELNTDNFGFNTFNSFKSFSKTRTNFTKDKKYGNTELNTLTSFNKENEKNEISKEAKDLRKSVKKK